jgi:hypothetical protein
MTDPRNKGSSFSVYRYISAAHLLIYRYLDALHLAIDANFKLKRKNRSNHEVLLGDGFAYFGNSEEYAQHLVDHKDPKEVGRLVYIF